MASNISQNTIPSLWSSANDDVIYNFSFNTYAIDSITDDGGNAKINLQNEFDVVPVPGEYIYILSNVYVGTFKILTVAGDSSVTIDTPYISSISSNVYNCYHLRVPVFSFYKGFKTGEEFPSDLPYTKVVDLKPSVLYDTSGLPYLEINVKGLTKRLFKIVSNTVANSTDFSMFNAIRIIWDNISTILENNVEYNLVCNCALTNEDLIENYTSVGLYNPFNSSVRYLQPVDKPFIATQGVTFASAFAFVVINIITAEAFPVVFKFINGVKQ